MAKINTPPGLGDSEFVTDTTFQERPWLFHPYYFYDDDDELYTNECATLPHHWAELKTSILSNMLVTKELKSYMVNFEKTILRNIYSQFPKKWDKFTEDFEIWVSKLDKAKQNRVYDAYPVSQAPLFAGNVDLAMNDVFILFNFIKYKVWGTTVIGSQPELPQSDGYIYNLETLSGWDPNICNLGLLVQPLILRVFMDPLFEWLEGLKGKRQTMETLHQDNPFWGQVGITYMWNDKLKREIPSGEGKKRIKPWLHPGNVRCKVSYWGKYGEKIRQARDENSIWASLMCGISGSANFFLWSYIISVANTETITDPNQDIRLLFLLAIAVLAGDGGHNVREVVYSLTITFSLLYNLFEMIEKELQDCLKPDLDLVQNISELIFHLDGDCIYPGYVLPKGKDFKEKEFGGEIMYSIMERIKDYMSQDKNFGEEIMYPVMKRDKDSTSQDKKFKCTPPWLKEKDINSCLFTQFLIMCKNIYPIVRTGYQATSHLNPTGLTKSDLQQGMTNYEIPKFNIDDPEVKTNFFTEYKRDAIYWLFYNNWEYFTGPVYSEEFLDHCQLFLALENDRYTQDNWENGADQLVEKMFREAFPTVGDKLMEDLNKIVLDTYQKCMFDTKWYGDPSLKRYVTGSDKWPQSKLITKNPKIPFAFPGKNKISEKVSSMPQGNIGKGQLIRHIQRGERILDEEDQRQNYFNLTDQYLDDGENFTNKCINFNRKSQKYGWPTLEELRLLRDDED